MAVKQTIEGEAIKNLELSLATSPKDPMIYAVHCNLGLAYLENGEPLKAEEHCQKSIEANPSWDMGIYGLITVLVENEKLQDAQVTLKRLLSLDEAASINKFQGSYRFGNKSLKGRMIDALRQVGLPDS